MSEWKKVKIDFKTIKLGDYIEPIKTTVAEMNMKNPIVYGVTNKEGIVQTGKPASKDISNYIALEENCFAFNPYRINVGSIGINDNNLAGCVSPAYVVFKTKNGLLPKFLFFYLKSDYGNHLINWYGNRGGVRNALRYSDLCNIDIPDIRSINQKLLLKKFSSVSESIHLITQELEIQKEYTKQLRQNILQDAIEGKLTADWRKAHPVIKGNPDYDAEALFEKIQEGKASPSLQPAKRSYATLSAVDTPATPPFEIPKGWKWVRLGEVISYTENLDIQKKLNGLERIKYVDIDSIDNQKYEISSYKEKNVSELSSRARRVLKKDFIIYSTVRPYLCNIAIIKEEYPNYIGSTGFNVFKTLSVKKEYVFYFLLSSYVIKLYSNMMQGFNSPSINNKQFENTLFPLPPLKEQEEIVAKVETLLAKVTELENQIQERKTYTKQLMQSILKNAFEEE